MNDTLLVPIQLEATVINQKMKDRGDQFRLWQFDYSKLVAFNSPEPEAFNTGIDSPDSGVYLHWTLPRSLRTTKPGSESVFPLVPNRWLIVRISRPHLTADENTDIVSTQTYILESDCPSVDASYYPVTSDILSMWDKSTDTFRNKANIYPSKESDYSYTQIGKVFDLTKLNNLNDKWSERSAETMFLTAVAPGNINFSIYTAHNKNVFSFQDDLSSIDESTISYFVTGWYSDISKDVIAGGVMQQDVNSVSDILSILNWTIANNAGKEIPVENVKRSLYTGIVSSLYWQPAVAPSDDPLQNAIDSKIIDVSIGNTAIDAFSSLLKRQLIDFKNSDQLIRLLRALQYEMLPLLNQANGDALLEENVKSYWFSNKSSGIQWQIVSSSDSNTNDTSQSASAEESQNTLIDQTSNFDVELTLQERSWLQQLNTDQKNFDEEIEKLYQAQWQVNQLWWKQGIVLNSDPSDPATGSIVSQITDIDSSKDMDTQYNDLLTKFSNCFDSNNPSNVIQPLLNQLEKINSILSNLPQPLFASGSNNQDALLKGIDYFAKNKGLPLEKRLKPISLPRYYKANNPIIALSGIDSSLDFDPNSSLNVRVDSQIITEFNIDGTIINTESVASFCSDISYFDTLMPPLLHLFQEFFLLDIANASLIAKVSNQTPESIETFMKNMEESNYNGIIPSVNLLKWTQPWNPIYVEWKVKYTPIPFKNNWVFNGVDYELDSAYQPDPDVDEFDIGGFSLLSPHTQYIFQSRLNKFLKDFGNTSLPDNQILLQQDIILQELVGFTETLNQRDGRAFRSPYLESFIDKTGQKVLLADILGYPGMSEDKIYSTPDQLRGAIHNVPYIDDSKNVKPFANGMRQGQFYFSQLWIYDKFGRVLEFVVPSGSESGIKDASTFSLIRDPYLLPEKNIVKETISSVVQLPPRLLKHAKLDMSLVDYLDSSKVFSINDDINPVCGWVISNHLDRGILLYLPDGTSAGELILTQGISQKKVNWVPPLTLKNASLEDSNIEKLSPHLYQFIINLLNVNENDFTTFLNTIDSTLWTIDPLGNRSDQTLTLLVGRPLALIRLNFKLKLAASPDQDVSWQYTFSPSVCDFASYKFPIRLGDQETREDGLIGYYLESDYTLFNSVVDPNSDKVLSSDEANTLSYIKQIGPNALQTDFYASQDEVQKNQRRDYNYLQTTFDPASSVYITALADPRAAIHAFTGILPVKKISIPAHFIDTALSNMEISFRVGPLLTKRLAGNDSDNPGNNSSLAIKYMPLAEQNGKWSWCEKDTSNNWTLYPLSKATNNAEITGSNTSLREGVLRLLINPK